MVAKKKGVQKGAKRGAYKKNKIVEPINEVETVEPINKIETVEPINEIETVEPINEVVETVEPINEIDIHEQKYQKFLNDNNDFNASEYKEDFIQPEIKTDEPKNLETEKKEFDFTKQNEAVNNVTPLDSLKQQQKFLINGMLLLSMCDLVFPSLIVYVYKMIDTNAELVDKNKIKLDTEQKASLKEVSDYAAGFIFEKLNPMLLFVIALGGMYYSNFSNELSKVEFKKKLKSNV